MMPFQFEMLWRLYVDGPQTASEILERLTPNLYVRRTPTTVANQLRSLHQGGLITSDFGGPAIYRLTPDGQEYVDR